MAIQGAYRKVGEFADRTPGAQGATVSAAVTLPGGENLAPYSPPDDPAPREMMTTTTETVTYKNDDVVTFKPGPKATTTVNAKVIGTSPSARGTFLVTEDTAGNVRKIRPGAVKLAA
jgi:hypothetical protein